MQNFDKHYDIDEMLFETVLWLAQQVDCNVSDFVEIAQALELRQEDWDTFWGIVQARIEAVEKIECEILGKERRLTEEEFEFVKQLLGEPQELSNCCGSEVETHNEDDHTSRCSDCEEGCGVVYFWNK